MRHSLRATLRARPYRVLVKPGDYAEAAFTRSGNDEPNQPVAVIGWGGPLRYRAGPFDVTWSDAGGTVTANESSVRRVFRSRSLAREAPDRVERCCAPCQRLFFFKPMQSRFRCGASRLCHGA